MQIGIIGSGHMGSALGYLWAQRGHQICFSYSRDSRKLRRTADRTGPNSRTGSPAEAARFGDVLLLAVPQSVVPEALKLAGSLTDKPLIVCVLPSLLSDGAVDMPDSVGVQVAHMAPNAEIVVAFSTISADVLDSSSRCFGACRPTGLYCGDSARAKALTERLIRDIDLEPLDVGPLAYAALIECIGAGMLRMRAAGFGSEIAFRILRR